MAGPMRNTHTDMLIVSVISLGMWQILEGMVTHEHGDRTVHAPVLAQEQHSRGPGEHVLTQQVSEQILSYHRHHLGTGDTCRTSKQP